MPTYRVVGFSVEEIPHPSWQIRFGEIHEVHGDAYTGALRISEVDKTTVEACALITLPPKEDIRKMKEYFYKLGYNRIILRRIKNGVILIREL